MTIDEAIALVKIEKECISRACDCDRKCNECDLVQDTDKMLELYSRLAEWLEKLKYIENIILRWNADWYNDEDNGIPDNEILEAIFNVCNNNGFDIPIDEDYRKEKEYGYNKAIDNFANLIKERKFDYIEQDLEFDDFIDILAEQLKAGGENEN